ncbi:hypothetical protein A2313_01655 [Candidatus Roizmanbacteria bacterium RIFOXYB2_FULL_41_10]|uniref:Nudix hydrolase domain-containing protein n=1 Tax=Candidatus Roizmanbacteria bacterium RIFOXYA1_FULL_41_12 TaxID=1802082 RepID=A0A1F7KGM9_9BACT|nr:MAG: hypothetical protein A2209_03095 [Candidatus Roizmanbacteria bacterium RIFOXYA1_FULL_41_12]OGK71074.1 MAG: hypothetical protein A2313_01655 [Candidatus Roizmanbacteria bacterium RIFOXYB2_FULL_41_10]OGK71690.1 MAG: hypothetical protein A2403_04500 [Candidatus Roizmanbacteria bacterium RIFOXYC1_FULL_41_16]OGK72961.1 MAG: hypothetical protein A2459_00375 [Candidatus Roizmanbacteria bacterium RIFOXYC2_FULL_41_10]OGK75016.1 MAG: hypothetical protein A2575_03775 [Candidatus Roizmanbacteria ba
MNLAKIKTELLKLKNNALIKKETWQEFWDKLHSGQPLTKTERNSEHMCAFFLPVHRTTKSVYLIHHIKGADWMPPGGHIEPHEHPLLTVRREYQEELGQSLAQESVELIGLTIKSITNHPLNYCTKHYDFWYAVWVDKQHDYSWDRREFHSAGWFEIASGINKIQKNPDYQEVIKNLQANHFYNRP